jgi:multisubunit Na+/H+ antiporter MnhF subunit
MNMWLAAVILLLPPLAVPMVVAWRGDANNRLAAVQLAGTLAALILAVMTFAFDQPSFIDLALCLTLVSVPGTLIFTTFMERWL